MPLTRKLNKFTDEKVYGRIRYKIYYLISPALKMNAAKKRPGSPLLRENETNPEIADLYTLMDFAKLDTNDINTNVQRISFSTCMENDHLKLLELDSSALAELENGGKLWLKGDNTKDCVLCTEDKTFEVKDTGISNSLLLTDGVVVHSNSSDTSNSFSLEKCEVKAIKHNYLEMRLVKPKVKPLMEILQKSCYEGPENEGNKTERFTFDELLEKIQASKTELKNTLDTLNAYTIDGYVRLLDTEYLYRVHASLASLMEERSWRYDEFNYRETCEILSSLYPLEIVQHVLKCYGEKKEGDMWSLSEDKVCRFYAEHLLRPTCKFNLNDFMMSWKDDVPEGMITSLDQIKGIGFVDRSSTPAVMRYFDESLLSEDIKLRFEEMFKVKKQWTVDEASPYIEPLCIGKQTVGVLLTKYARAFNKDGTKYYTSKYVK